MASTIQAQVLGLNFSNNQFSAAPAGSLARANDVNVNAAGLLEPRRGFSVFATFGTSTDTANSIGQYNATSFVTQYGASGQLSFYNGSTFTDYPGTYLAPSPTTGRMRFVQAAGNLHLNTSTATKVILAGATTPLEAGVPKALDVSATPNPGSAWQTYNTAVAYRYVLSTKDPQGNVKLGAPSGRNVVKNRVLVPATHLTRTGGALVTAATSVPDSPHFLVTGDSITINPGEANFAAGTFAVTVTSPWTFTYAQAGANVSSTLDQDAQITRSVFGFANLPPNASTSHFIQVFRSEMTATSGDEPSDELYQCYQANVTSTDVSNGFVSFADVQPESLLGDPLYTNPSQQGLAQANERPPIGLDLTFFQNRLWIANTTSRHRFELDLLGVTAPGGLQNNWTVTIADKTYTAKTTPGAATDFQLFTTFTTPSLNVAATARALATKINLQSALVSAFYISGTDDSSGRLLIEERGIGGSAFNVSSQTSIGGQTSCWNPQLPTVAGATAVSDNSALPNGISYSNLDEPEAFPLLNYQTVGPKNSHIQRIVGLRDRLYVFSDDGIYTLSGGAPPFRIEKIAETRLYAADSVVLLGEAVWALTDQGVVRITETGVSVVSRPIESEVTKLFGGQFAINVVRQLAFAVGHESARQLVVYLPSSLTSTFCDQAYVYNTATSAWTRWTVGATCGFHDPTTDCLMLGSPTTDALLVQRNSRDLTDYRDPEFTTTLNSATGKVLTLTSVTGINAGDRIKQGTNYALVASVDTTNTQVTLQSTHVWTPGTVTVYPAVNCDALFNPLTAGSPALLKLFRDVSFMFQKGSLTGASIDTSTDVAPAIATSTLSFATFGSGAWGDSYWGNPSKALARLAPVTNGQCAQLNIGIRIREAGAYWQLAGFAAEREDSPGKNGV